MNVGQRKEDGALTPEISHARHMEDAQSGRKKPCVCVYTDSKLKVFGILLDQA